MLFCLPPCSDTFSTQTSSLHLTRRKPRSILRDDPHHPLPSKWLAWPALPLIELSPYPLPSPLLSPVPPPMRLKVVTSRSFVGRAEPENTSLREDLAVALRCDPVSCLTHRVNCVDLLVPMGRPGQGRSSLDPTVKAGRSGVAVTIRESRTCSNLISYRWRMKRGLDTWCARLVSPTRIKLMPPGADHPMALCRIFLHDL